MLGRGPGSPTSPSSEVYSRRIFGGNVASSLKADILPLCALDMAVWAADENPDELIHDSDHGSNYMAMISRPVISTDPWRTPTDSI